MGIAAGNLPRSGQNISLGEALSQYVKDRFKHNTAKEAAIHYGVDLETARNVVKGHVSARFLALALAADAYEIADAIVFGITNTSRADWEREEINRLVGELENAKDRHSITVARATAMGLVAQTPSPARLSYDGPGRRASDRSA